MKALLVAIVSMALLLGIRQAVEADRLATRERELKGRKPGAAGIANTVGKDSGSGDEPRATKLERQGKEDFDAASYVGKLKNLFSTAMQRDILPAEQKFMQEDLLDASVDELLKLPQMIAEAGLPPEAATFIYESTSIRLLDRDPAMACNHSIKGGDLKNFLLVAKTWISRDPAKAAEWLEMRSKSDPPLNEKTLAHYNGNPPLDLPGLLDAARIAAATSSADLGRITKLKGSDLGLSMADILQAMPSDNFPVFLKRLAGEGREDLLELAMRRHPDPQLARDYLKQVALPPATFNKVAEAALGRLDPADLPRGMAWFLENSDPALRGESLNRLVGSWTQANPQSVARWIAKLPEGADRDRAMQAHHDALAHPVPRHEPPR